MDFSDNIDSFERNIEKPAMSDLYFEKTVRRCVEASLKRINVHIETQERRELIDELNRLYRTLGLVENKPTIGINIDWNGVNGCVETAITFLKELRR